MKKERSGSRKYDGPQIELLIAEAYEGLLGRLPEPDETDSYAGRLEDALTWEGFVEELVGFPEFSDIHPVAETGHFEEVQRLRPLLVRVAADVTVGLEAVHARAAGLMMRGPVRDVTIMHYLIQSEGIWQPSLTEFTARLLRPGDTFIDVGANLGYFSLVAAALVGPGSVVAFEPNSALRKYCSANIKLNGLGNVQLSPYALWNEKTLMEMLPEDEPFHLGGAHLALEASQVDHTETVSCDTLDRLLQEGEVSIDEESLKMIKIDIEGAEPFALEGMSGLLSRTRPVLAVEVNKDALERLDKTVESVWARLTADGYQAAILPDRRQTDALGHLETVRTDVPLSRLSSLDQVLDLVERLDRAHPPSDPFDLVCVPKEKGFSELGLSQAEFPAGWLARTRESG